MLAGMQTKGPPKLSLRMENFMEEEGLMMDTVLTAQCLPSRHANNKESQFHVKITLKLGCVMLTEGDE